METTRLDKLRFIPWRCLCGWNIASPATAYDQVLSSHRRPLQER